MGFRISRAIDCTAKKSPGELAANPASITSIPNSTKYFQELYKMGKENNLGHFSMGMSNDYEKAIICGSTHVRIGSSLFGLRKY